MYLSPKYIESSTYVIHSSICTYIDYVHMYIYKVNKLIKTNINHFEIDDVVGSIDNRN